VRRALGSILGFMGEEWLSSRVIVMRLLLCSVARRSRGVTRWGLFLRRGVHIFFGSVAYGKRSRSDAEGSDANPGPPALCWLCLSLVGCKKIAQMLCQKGRILMGEVLYDDYQIESSTEEARVKSGAPVDDILCVMVSDKPFSKNLFF